MAHLNSPYYDDAAFPSAYNRTSTAGSKPSSTSSHHRPLRKPSSNQDFELFGPGGDDLDLSGGGISVGGLGGEDMYKAQPPPLPPLPWEYNPHQQPSYSPQAQATNIDQYSPTMSALPDLVPDVQPDSPTSPALSYLPNPALRQHQQQQPDARSNSASISDSHPFSQQASVRRPSGSSNGGARSNLTDLFASQPEGAFSLGPSNPPSSTSLPYSYSGMQPPLQPVPNVQQRAGQQQQLQQTGLNPALHALSQFYQLQQRQQPVQYGFNTSHQPSSTPAAPPLQAVPQGTAHLSPPQQLRQREADAESFRRTVSPQEAFLDYDDVDHALHSNPLFQSSFGVGVGTGRSSASLFAPLPSSSSTAMNRSPSGSAAAPSRTTTPRPAVASSTLQKQVADGGGSTGRGRTGSPALSVSSVKEGERAGSVGPSGAGSSSAAKYASRFSVPSNAVNWDDQDDDDEEDDDDDESPELRPTSAGAGKSPVLSSRKLEEKLEDEADENEDGGQATAPPLPAKSSGGGQFAGKSVRREPGDAALAAAAQAAATRGSQHFGQQQLPHHAAIPTSMLPPLPGAAGSSSPHATRSTSPAVHGRDKKVKHASPPAPSAIAASASTSAPARSARLADRHPSKAAADDVDHDDSLSDASDDLDDSDEYVPAVPVAAPGGHARRGSHSSPAVGASKPSVAAGSAGSAKRSRTATYGDDEDASASEEDGSFDAEVDDDDASEMGDDDDHPAPRRKGQHNPQPNKRRRRAPPPSALTASSSSSIRCPHVYQDGSACGVVFRRPYDLARHKETIHGEGGKAKKDWVCEECQGSFSRKDALIRHARIRSHHAGI